MKNTLKQTKIVANLFMPHVINNKAARGLVMTKRLTADLSKITAGTFNVQRGLQIKGIFN